MGVFFTIFFIAMIIAILMIFVLYLVTAIAIYLFAKDSNIENPWLAFVPLGNYWILGKMAGEISLGNIRIKNPGIVYLIGWVISFSVSVFDNIFSYLTEENMKFALISIGISGVSLIISLVIGAFQGFIFYNIFRKYGENNAILFAVLSCIVPFALPIIFFYMRKKYLKPYII